MDEATPSPVLTFLWRLTAVAVAGSGLALCWSIGQGAPIATVRSLAALLAAFAAFKLVVVAESLHRLRLARSAAVGVLDPRLRHRPPWLYWGWIGWRLAAAACAAAAAIYLLQHPEVGTRLTAGS